MNRSSWFHDRHIRDLNDRSRHTFVVELSQRVQEIHECFVPRVRVIQVTRVSCALHHHHSVIGQTAEVPEWQLSQLSVLVTIDYQRGDLEELQDKKNLWFPLKLLRQEKKFDFEKVPSHSGTAPAWICLCRWEPRGCRLGPGSGTGGGTGGSTFHWGTGWSPPRGAGRGAHTPPSGNPQGPVHQSLPAPQQILTGRVLKTLNPQQNT